jgi:hypothetical protein
METFHDRLRLLVAKLAPKFKNGKPKHTVFAKEVGIEGGAWDEMYNKENFPGYDNLKKLGRYCSLDWLIMGRGPALPETELPSDEEFSSTARYSVKTEVLLEKAAYILESGKPESPGMLRVLIEGMFAAIKKLEDEEKESK